MTPRRAWQAALLLPYVALSSYLGLTGRFLLFGGWDFVVTVWTASAVADIVFVLGTIAAGVTAWTIARAGRVGTSMLAAFALHSVVYVASFMLFVSASDDPGAAAGIDLRSGVPFVISAGIVGLVFASITPGMLVQMAARDDEPTEGADAESV